MGYFLFVWCLFLSPIVSCSMQHWKRRPVSAYNKIIDLNDIVHVYCIDRIYTLHHTYMHICSIESFSICVDHQHGFAQPPSGNEAVKKRLMDWLALLYSLTHVLFLFWAIGIRCALVGWLWAARVDPYYIECSKLNIYAEREVGGGEGGISLNWTWSHRRLRRRFCWGGPRLKLKWYENASHPAIGELGVRNWAI